MREDNYLKDYSARISSSISDYYLEILNYPDTTPQSVTEMIQDTLLESLRSNYEYFKDQYEKAKYALEHFERKERSCEYTAEIEKDSITGEEYFTIPKNILTSLNWKEGDTLEWKDQNDGTFMIQKVLKENK